MGASGKENLINSMISFEEFISKCAWLIESDD